MIDKENIIYVPKVYEQFNRRDLIVMEELKGIPFARIKKGSEDIDDIERKLKKGVHLFVQTLLADGFFHADLHGGNFFLLENSRIGLVDFGLVGHLSKKSRISLVSILYSLVTNNEENLVFEFFGY